MRRALRSTSSCLGGMLGFTFCIAGLTACPEVENPDAGTQNSDAGVDAGTRVDGGVATDAGTDAGSLPACPTNEGATDHPFSRTCVEDEDCGFAEMQRDCCGTLNAFGVDNDDLADFKLWASTCDALLPECDCLAEPAYDDVGGRARTVTEEPTVSCNAGRCETAFPAAPGCFDIPAAQGAFDRTCADVDECQVALVVGGCCGELHALGVNYAAVTYANEWSNTCGPEATCDCIPFETTADDGSVGPVDGTGAFVQCTNNVCTAGFPAP